MRLRLMAPGGTLPASWCSGLIQACSGPWVWVRKLHLEAKRGHFWAPTPLICPGLSQFYGFCGGSAVKNPPANAGDAVTILWLERSPGEGMATHSSIPAWRIPRTEEPSGLQSTGSKELGMIWWLNCHLLPALALAFSRPWTLSVLGNPHL